MAALFLRPDADQSDGSWLNELASNTNLFNSVDESSFSDTDYIKSSSTSGDKVRLRLSDPGVTVSAPMTVRYRCKKDGSGSANVIGRLFQGTAPGTQIATWTQALTTTFTTYTYTLTSPEFSSISDFNDLYVEFEYNLWWLDGASIDLWFATSRYYETTDGVAVTSYLSCSRASVGYAKTSTGALTSFGTNTLRITDLGLLVEDARTNIAFPSQNLSGTGAWGPNQASITAAQGTAPDGTLTMDKLTEDTSNNRHMVEKPFITTTGVTYTFSVFAKDVDRQFMSLVMATGAGAQLACVADLQNGTITQSGIVNSASGTVFTSASIEAFSGGVYRIGLTGIADNLNTSIYCDIALSNTGTPSTYTSGCPSYTGTSKSILAWGAQLEQASFASSYIPTTTSSATRAADAVSCSGSLDTLLKATARSAVVDITASATPVTWDIISGSTAGNQLVVSSSNVIVTSDTATKSFSGSGTFTAGVKVGSGTNGTATSVTGAGLTVATGSSGTANTGTVYLGSDGTNFWYGYIDRATFFNSKIADATLQGFTA